MRCVVRCSVALALCAIVTGGESVLACPYSIRDSAFIKGGRGEPYRLFFLMRDDTLPSGKRADFASWVEDASVAFLDGSNVVSRVVDVDGPGGADFRKAVSPEFRVPEELPAAVLVSSERKALLLPGPGSAPSMETVLDVVAQVVESPLRARIRSSIVKSWCVLLVVEGADAADNERAQRQVRAAAAKIIGSTTELDKVVTTGPEVIRVSAATAAERIALWGLGLRRDDGEKASVRVAMLTGRGELRGPILEGAAVTAVAVHDALVMLGRSCSCTTAAHWLSGPALPLVWGLDMQTAVATELGFDPDNPDALRAMKDILDGAGLDASLFGVGEVALGYTEMTPGSRRESPGPADGAEIEVPARSQITVPDTSAATDEMPETRAASTTRVILMSIMVFAAVGLAAMTVVVLRRQRGSGQP